MIIFLLFLSIFSITIHAIHFNGGTITYAPINPYTNSSPVDITLTQSYSWTYPTIACTTNVPVSSGHPDANLTCIANCSTDGGYSNAPIDILTDCTSYSSSLGMMFSQRSVNTTLSIGAYFYIAYTGNAWRDLYSPPINGLSWSIVTLIDLRLRDDGIIDSPPVANVISPQYVMVNTTTLINIPVSDANEGDNIRCRWAIDNVNSSIDECSGICYPGGLPNGTTLSNCTLSFTGLVPSVWYPIALQVEDFMNETSMEPMSSVPVQFLIYVLPTPTCTILPLILPLTDCLEVQVGVTMNFTLYAMNLCNSTVIITDIIISQGISGMTAGSLTNSTTNSSLSYIILTWTPQVNQIGSQELCLIAYNTLLVQSIQYCTKFTVTTTTPNCPIITTTGKTTTETPNKEKGSINIPLIVGLSLLALMLILCCCCCCWLYYLFWGVAARRRRAQQEKEREKQQKPTHLLPSIITRNRLFKSFNNNYLVHKISKNEDSKHTLFINTPTSLPRIPEKRICIASTKIIENIHNNQSFTEEPICFKSLQHQNNDITKLCRNKVSAINNTPKFNDNQRKDRSNTITTTTSINDDIIIEDSNVCIHQDEPMSVIKLNGDETPIVRKTRIIKVISPTTEKRRRNRSNDVGIANPSITEDNSLRKGNIHVTRLRKLSDDIQTKKNHEKSIFPENNEEHTNNKVIVTSIPRHKSKTRPHISKHRKSIVDIMN